MLFADVDLSWMRDIPPLGAPIGPTGASTRTGGEDQLGLKLQSAVASAEILVVDSVEHRRRTRLGESVRFHFGEPNVRKLEPLGVK